MYMKPGQRKIDLKGIKAEEFIPESPVMTSNLGWINRIVGKSKPVVDTTKAKKLEEARARVNSYKPQANLSYLNMILSK